MKKHTIFTLFTLTCSLMLAGCTARRPDSSGTTPAAAAPVKAPPPPLSSGVIQAEKMLVNGAAEQLSMYARMYQSAKGNAPGSFSDFVVPGKPDNQSVISLSDLSLEKCTMADTEITCDNAFTTVKVTYRLENGKVITDSQSKFQ